MNQIADQIEDQTPDDSIILMGKDGEKPKSEFTRPAYSFKGNELFPFTYGYELLFNQVRDAEDTGLYTWLAFVYLLYRKTRGDSQESESEHRKWAISIAWRVETFREALTAWVDAIGPITTEDKIEAKRIYEENMKAIADATVEPTPVRGKAQKKTSRQKTQSSSTSSAINSGVAVTKSSGA